MLFMFATCLIFLSVFHVVNGSFTSCIHGGTKYKDGDYFPPNKTFIQINDSRQCVQCRCHQGLVICEVENCTSIDCEKPVKHSQFCCLRCPGNETPSDEITDLIFGQTNGKEFPKKKTSEDCLSNGQLHANGSTWQPVIGPFGAMACVQCRCRDGNVICARLRCHNNQPCSHPKREFGECCPVCHFPDNDDKFQKVCLPKASEIFVFKTANLQNDSESIEHAFLENNSKNEITVYSWTLMPRTMVDSLTIKTCARKELEKMEFQLLGSISHKRFRKYAQRSERLRIKCFVQCLKKLNRLESSLGIFPAVVKTECGRTEMDVSTF